MWNTAASDTRPSRIRTKLQADFDGYKRLESHLHSQHKLLEAKEASLKAAQDQLAKVIAKKREFELRLAQLEAEEETLQVARLGSKLQLDDSRATQIEAVLSRRSSSGTASSKAATDPNRHVHHRRNSGRPKGPSCHQMRPRFVVISESSGVK